MHPDTTWYLSLDRQHLYDAHTVDGPLDLVDYDLDFISQQAPSATVDAVTDLTDQSLYVYFAISHTREWKEVPARPARRVAGANSCCSSCAHEPCAGHLASRKSRPVRCRADELRDCITWLVYQTLEDISSIPLNPQFNGDCNRSGWSFHEEIEHAFWTCPPELAQFFLRALYFAAVALRLLDPEELFDAVMVSSENRGSLVSSDVCRRSRPPGSSQDLIRLCSGILIIGSKGKVEFRVASMREFLAGSDLLGQGSGDESMARLCLEYLIDDPEWHIIKPWRRFGARSRSAAAKPFFKYASTYWHRHYRASERATNDLAAKVHQKVECDVTFSWGAEGLLHIELQKLCLQMGLGVCRYYGFDFLQQLYIQMGASDGAVPDVTNPFPQSIECMLLFADTIRKVPAVTGLKPNDGAGGYFPTGTGDADEPVMVETSSTGCLTDGDSQLEESWASLSPKNQSEHWISDFDDLRLDIDIDEHVIVHQLKRKNGNYGWEMVDRTQELGS